MVSKKIRRRYQAISGQSGLVQIDGSESQNGIRWTAEAIYAGYRGEGLVPAVEACDRGGYYTRHPKTDEVCQIDCYMGLAWIADMLDRSIARKWLWYGLRKMGFYGPVVFRNWMPRYIGLTTAMVGAGLPLLKLPLGIMSTLATLIAIYDIGKKANHGETHHDGYALTYQLMEIVPPLNIVKKEFMARMRVRFGGATPRETYANMLVDWNSKHWRYHPTVALLKTPL